VSRKKPVPALPFRYVNGASGTSAHEYDTTVDVPYSGCAAPAEPIVEPDLGGACG
jgi:hypothetical protein